MTTARHIVVVGASQAGSSCAAALRAAGFDGPITMIGDEPHRPYTRPPLSKGVLLGEQADDTVFLSGDDDVDLITGTAAVGLDPERRLLALGDGDFVSYDGLIIATGARARRIAPPGQHGEFTLRTLDDAVRLRARLAAARDVAVAGGGFLGMEIASSAAALGKTVTVVDQVTPLAAHLGPLLSEICLMAAAECGVKVRVENPGVKLGFDGENPSRLLSAEGEVLTEADVVISAVGDLPNVEWLHRSGLNLAGGVLVDERCRVAPDIVAAGDVVTTGTDATRRCRSPHWWNAMAQAKTAAAALLGHQPDAPTASNPPYFWTEAFGLHIRIAGHLRPMGEPEVVDGSIGDRHALLVWPTQDRDYGTAVSLNYPISANKLARLAQHTSTQQRTP